MQAIIYAMGQIFNRYRENIMWEHVVAIADKNPKDIREFNSVPIITPQEIASLQYDCIAIFSNKWFEEIKSDLVGTYFISPDKIISWRDFITETIDDTFTRLQTCRTYLEECGSRKVLDFGMSVLPNYFLMKEEFLAGDGTVLDGVPGLSAKYNSYLYDHVYEKEKVPGGDLYDAVLVWDTEQLTDSFWNWVQRRAKCVLFYTPYLLNGRPHRAQTKAVLQRHGLTACLSFLEGLFWCVEINSPKPSISAENITIFVVTHKEYNPCNDSLYCPLCVGSYQRSVFLTEQAGENIAYLNRKINECTALYWIWKNTSEPYVGLNHYRRYFYNNQIINRDNYLDMRRAGEILEEYDIILPKAYPLYYMTLFEQLCYDLGPELCRKGYQILKNEIAQKQPDYLSALDDVLNGHTAFWCNLFVTRREILDRYCEWLFSFLIDAAIKLDVDSCDSYGQRTMGFFAERMLTVWLRKQQLKIKELPWVIIS